jgi:methylmalonyl-CoA mutase N-terminal domain/subunit
MTAKRVRREPQPVEHPSERERELERLRTELAAWRAKAEAIPTRDDAGINAVKPVYTPLDLSPDLVSATGLPGQYPYTRGIHPTMYRGRLWTMRQFAGFGTA